MRQISFNAYRFHELLEDTQQKIIDRKRDELSRGYHWSGEVIETLEAAAEFFQMKIRDYAIHWDGNGSRIQFSFEGDYHLLELSGEKLKPLFHERAEYGSIRNKWGDRKGYVPLLAGNCAFTGVCFDEDFLDPYKKFYQGDTEYDEHNLEELFQAGFDSLCESARKDFEWQCSEERAREEIEQLTDEEYTWEGIPISELRL